MCPMEMEDSRGPRCSGLESHDEHVWESLELCFAGGVVEAGNVVACSRNAWHALHPGCSSSFSLGVLGGRAMPEQKGVAPPLAAAAGAKTIPRDACHASQ